MNLERSKALRVLLYSHDTFGLGHLRRCRAIARALADFFPRARILIISGAAVAGAFDYGSRVEVVQIPGVVKLKTGEYGPTEQHPDFGETIRSRRSVIQSVAERFRPDVFIVDKEPMGFHGEVEGTLAYLKKKGTLLVLGLRDVMDAPDRLGAEWKRNDTMRKIGMFFDRIWVYGPADFYDPLIGLDVPVDVRSRMKFVGFLRRRLGPDAPPRRRGDYLLVTAGGGGDGYELIDGVIGAYRHRPDLTRPAIVVLGPYMPAADRARLLRSARDVPPIEFLDFDGRVEGLIAGGAAVVAMGGYNTFCEIVSFDKPSLVVPRVEPRQEQLVRAKRAADLGLVEMLLPNEAHSPDTLAAVLQHLPSRKSPSGAAYRIDLDGLTQLSADLESLVRQRLERNRGHAAAATRNELDMTRDAPSMRPESRAAI